MAAFMSESNFSFSATGVSAIGCASRFPLPASRSGYLENHLAGFARFDGRDRRVCLAQREAVRDDRRRIELTRFEKPRHLVPRLIHAATDDAVDREALEDDLGRQIEVHFLR